MVAGGLARFDHGEAEFGAGFCSWPIHAPARARHKPLRDRAVGAHRRRAGDRRNFDKSPRAGSCANRPRAPRLPRANTSACSGLPAANSTTASSPRSFAAQSPRGSASIAFRKVVRASAVLPSDFKAIPRIPSVKASIVPFGRRFQFFEPSGGLRVPWMALPSRPSVPRCRSKKLRVEIT